MNPSVVVAALVGLVVLTLIGMVANWIPQPRWLPRQLLPYVLALLIVAAVLLGLGTPPARVAAADVTIVTPPAGAVVRERPTAFMGSIEGSLANEHALWGVIRAEGEDLFHPMDEECTVTGPSWICPPLYIGLEEGGDEGQRFEIRLIDADPATVRTLETYALRDKSGPDAYRGIELPASAQTLVVQTVVRGAPPGPDGSGGG